MICGDVGDLDLVLTAAPPGTPVALGAQVTPAAALPAGVRLHVAYRATNSRTSAQLSGGQSADISCGEIALPGVRFAALSNGPLPRGVLAADTLDATLVISLEVAEQPAPFAAAAAVPGAGDPFPFATALQSYLSTRSGRVSVAVFDATTGTTYSYNPATRYVTASIVKAGILGALLRQAQDAKRSLTATERSLATRMIELSDNAAASSLWKDIGRETGFKTFANRVGMPSTSPGTQGFWGLTLTNAPDQVRLVRTIAYPNAVLADASRSYQESLMRAVTPSQKWGVTGGVPASATVALKNGWLPRAGGWVINSIGHVEGGARDYAIAVLTSGNPSMSYGITTIEHVSAMVWGAGTTGTRISDFNRDGLTDVVARDAGGTLWLYPGNGNGRFLGGRVMSHGWNSFTALITPGDVTGDGNADVLARDPSGTLWLYPGNGSSGFGARRRLGSGWGGYSAIVEAANLNGTGRPDLLALDSTGALWLVPMSGNAVLGGRTRIGTGWNGYAVTGPGDLTGDRRPDVLARDPAGVLWLYPGDGAGGLGSRRALPGSWAGLTALITPGNWDRAGGGDLLARDASGRLWLYPGTNAGGFGSRTQIGTGWNGMTFIG